MITWQWQPGLNLKPINELELSFYLELFSPQLASKLVISYV
jgi:hypothetical protein